MKKRMSFVAAVFAAVTVVATPKALHFQSRTAGSIVKGAHYADLTTFTATAWVKNPCEGFKGDSGLSVILAQGSLDTGNLASGFSLFVGSTNTVTFQIRDTNSRVSQLSVHCPDIDTDNTWHFFAVTLDWERKIQRLYCDGVLKAEATGDSLPDPTPADGTCFSIGACHLKNASGGDRYDFPLLGSVGQVTLWNRALDATEIRAMMFARAHGSEPGIIGCWSLNGELSDAATPAHNLAIVNGATDILFEDAPDYPLAEEMTLTLTSASGSMSYIRTNRNFPNLTNFTACAWVRNPDTGNGASGVIFGQGALGVDSGFVVYRSKANGVNDGVVKFQTRGGDVAASLSVTDNLVSDGKWHFLAVTHDYGAKIKRLYWDGVLAGEETNAANLPDPSSTRDFVIGARYGKIGSGAANYAWAMNGSIAHVSLWNAALTEGEVRQLIHRDPYGNETNLLGYWPIDEASGTTVYDRSANGVNGTIVGSRYFRGASPYPFSVAGTATGHNGAGVLTLTSASGDASYVKTGKNFPNLTNFTACAWVRNPDTGNGASGIIFAQGALGADSGFAVYRYKADGVNNGVVIFQTRGGDVPKGLYVTNNLVSDGKWHFLAVTHDYGAKVKRFYWDGVLAGEETNAANLPNPSSTRGFAIGARYGNNGAGAVDYRWCMNGSIAHVSLWNTALTQADIEQLLAQNPVGTESNLLGYWPIDEVAGTTVYDRSAGGNNGTIVGSRYTRMLNYDCFNGAAADVCFDEVGDTNFTARVRIHSLADGATAAVRLAWGPAADDLCFTNEVGTVTSAGEIVSTTVASADLSQTNYFAKVLMESSGLRRESSVVAFSTDAFPWADYRKLEYIESTGTQLIDTDWLPTADAKFKAEIQFPQAWTSSAGGNFVGAKDSDDTNLFTFNFGSGGGATKDTIYFWLTKPSVAGGKYASIVGASEYRDSRAVIYASGTSTAVRWGDKWAKTNDKKASGHTVSTLAIFGTHKYGTTYEPFGYGPMRVYSCTLWDGSTLVRDFIPCCEKDGLRRAGLWDRVEGKFHPNAMENGTDFVRGPRIVLPWQRVGLMLIVQ